MPRCPRLPCRRGPTGPTVETAIEEPLRYLSLLPALLDREAYLLVQEGYSHIRRRLVELFQQANAPQPAVGVKHGRYQVTDDQYAVLEALPWPQATRDELVDAHRVIGSCLLEVGPRSPPSSTFRGHNPSKTPSGPTFGGSSGSSSTVRRGLTGTGSLGPSDPPTPRGRRHFDEHAQGLDRPGSVHRRRHLR